MQEHSVPIDELPPNSTADVSYADGEIVARLRVPCDVPLDEVSRYAVGMYLADAAHGLAFVAYCVRCEIAEAAERLTELVAAGGDVLDRW